MMSLKRDDGGSGEKAKLMFNMALQRENLEKEQ